MAPRLENALNEDVVADSLLDDSNIVAVMTHEGQFVRPEDSPSDAEHGESVFDNPQDYFAEALYDQEHDAAKLGDAGLAEKLAREGQAEPEQTDQPKERLRSERAPQESEQPEQEQAKPAQELTPEQYREGIERTDAAIEEFALNDDAHKFAAECAPFLGGAALENAPLLASLTSRATIGARDALLRAYESGVIDPAGDMDFAKIAPVGPQAARECSRAFAEICGVNWQMNPPANEMQLANTLHLGLANLLHAHVKAGGSTNPQELNEKQACVWFAEALQKGLTGKENPVSEEKAVEFVNNLTGRVLGIIGKIKAGEQARQAQGPRPNSGRGQRIPRGLAAGIRGSKAPKMSSNQDIFPDSIVAAATTQRL
jgi:hypothetical protein